MADANQDVNNLGVGKGRPGGYGATAPAGFDLAQLEDVTKTLDELMKANTQLESLGYIGEDGLTFTTDTDTNDITEWGGNIVSSELSSYGESVQVPFLESRAAVLKTVYGEVNVTTEGAITTVRHNNRFTEPRVFVFDSVISSTKVRRSIIPLGRIFERDDLSLNNSDVVSYTPTIKCMPYAGYDGDAYRDFIYDAAYVAPLPEPSTKAVK